MLSVFASQYIEWNEIFLLYLIVEALNLNIRILYERAELTPEYNKSFIKPLANQNTYSILSNWNLSLNIGPQGVHYYFIDQNQMNWLTLGGQIERKYKREIFSSR